MKKILFFAVLGALGTSLFTSCSNDDALVTPQGPDELAADYSAAYKAKFGTTEINTVKTVDVIAQIPQGKGNYTLRVYDGYPSANSGAQMVGKFENLSAGSTISKKVNCPGNADRLFFTAERNGVSMVTNCGIKNNKVVAKFDEGGSAPADAIDGTFNLSVDVANLEGETDNYAQFSKLFYDNLPTALTNIKGLFEEGKDHRTAGADAFFFFNEEGQVIFYPIFQNEALEDHIGYFVYNTATGEIVGGGSLIENSITEDFLWRGSASQLSDVYPKQAKGATGVQLSGNQFMYSQAYVVNVPEGYEDNFEDLVVGITVSNEPYGNNQVELMYGETYYSIHELNADNTVANAQVAVYASGKIETTEIVEDQEITTTRTFGLVGIEDKLNVDYNPDYDMNDIVLFTEATQATTINLEKPAKYFIAFEDLGGTYDFDFNDVVLEIDYVSGWELGTVKCVAAGGTLPVEVFYDGESFTPRGQDDATSIWGEIHEAFGVDVQTVVNTIPNGGTMGKMTGVVAEPLEALFLFGEDFLIAEDGIPFYLVVDGQFGQKRIEAKGEDGTPQAIVIGTTWTRYPGTWNETQEYVDGEDITDPAFKSWQWPIEKTDIEEAYPDIQDFVNDPTNLNWLKTGVSSKLYK